MPKYKVTVTKKWNEAGEVLIDAHNEDEARELAQEMLLDGGDEIEWGQMDPQGEDIESVEEVT